MESSGKKKKQGANLVATNLNLPLTQMPNLGTGNTLMAGKPDGTGDEDLYPCTTLQHVQEAVSMGGATIKWYILYGGYALLVAMME